MKARRRRSRSGGETAEIRSELEPFEFYICVQCTHISEALVLLGWRPSHLPAPCWPGTLQSRAVLSLGPLHLLWYCPDFSHLLSVPELPDCATLGGTIGVVSDVKGALGTQLRIADLPCWPCGDTRGKTAGCTSVALGTGSPGGPFSYFPQSPVPLFWPPSCSSLQCQPCWEDSPRAKAKEKGSSSSSAYDDHMYYLFYYLCSL